MYLDDETWEALKTDAGLAAVEKIEQALVDAYLDGMTAGYDLGFSDGQHVDYLEA